MIPVPGTSWRKAWMVQAIQRAILLISGGPQLFDRFHLHCDLSFQPREYDGRATL
jgi:hypothetical protein